VPLVNHSYKITFVPSAAQASGNAIVGVGRKYRWNIVISNASGALAAI
jgi:hypothetical protein